MGEFRMPSLGADMERGTIVSWRVQPGDVVHRGDIVAVVDTEKSDIEVEVFEDGVVEELLVAPGEEVAVGTPLARIGEAAAASPPPAGAGTGPGAGAGAAPRSAARASPRARRLAAERGVDLTGVAGSGPGGAVLTADLDGAAPAPVPAAPEAPAAAAAGPEPAPVPEAPGATAAAVSSATAALMARSAAEIPQYHVATTIDLEATTRWLTARNEGVPPSARLLPAAALLRATALAAAEVPELNGTWDGGHRRSAAVHLGVAVGQRRGGVVAATIPDAQALAVDDLMAALQGLVERVRAGRLRSGDVTGATITVTDLGDRGADEVLGLIHPPQVALVGFGRIAERPIAVDGMLAIRPTVRATVAGDHRASEGRDASRFLRALDRHLQEPASL